MPFAPKGVQGVHTPKQKCCATRVRTFARLLAVAIFRPGLPRTRGLLVQQVCGKEGKNFIDFDYIYMIIIIMYHKFHIPIDNITSSYLSVK